MAAKMNTDKTKEGHDLRRKLFRDFDPNGNGYLSLAEVRASKLGH
jgi:hypothetical protein